MNTVSFRLSAPLLISLLFITSCNGQVNTNLSRGRGEMQKTAVSGYPTIRKTQGSNQYANIHCGLMDKAGNLWFGTTDEGVYRYDGKYFTQFLKKDGLSSNRVWSILADKAGNIWFGTDAGLCRYNGKTFISIPIVVMNSSFLQANTVSINSPSAQNEVWSMMEDKHGKLWFGTSEGVYCYNGTSFTRLLHDTTIMNKDGLQLKMVDCMLEDKQGNIWFGSGMPPGMEGLCRFDGKGLTRFKPGGDDWIRYLLEDRAGTIWSGGRHQGVWRFDGRKFTQFMKGGNANGVASLEDKAGNIWFSGGENKNGFGSDGGIWRYNGKVLSTGPASFTNFTTKDGLGDYSVWCLVEDKVGNIWVGTRNTGLYRYDGKTFTDFSDK